MTFTYFPSIDVIAVVVFRDIHLLFQGNDTEILVYPKWYELAYKFKIILYRFCFFPSNRATANVVLLDRDHIFQRRKYELLIARKQPELTQKL